MGRKQKCQKYKTRTLTVGLNVPKLAVHRSHNYGKRVAEHHIARRYNLRKVDSKG